MQDGTVVGLWSRHAIFPQEVRESSLQPQGAQQRRGPGICAGSIVAPHREM